MIFQNGNVYEILLIHDKIKENRKDNKQVIKFKKLCWGQRLLNNYNL